MLVRAKYVGNNSKGTLGVDLHFPPKVYRENAPTFPMPLPFDLVPKNEQGLQGEDSIQGGDYSL